MHSHTCTQRGKTTCKHSDRSVEKTHTYIYICMKKSRGEKRREREQQRDSDICSYDITSEERMRSHRGRNEREKDVKVMPVTPSVH